MRDFPEIDPFWLVLIPGPIVCLGVYKGTLLSLIVKNCCHISFAEIFILYRLMSRNFLESFKPDTAL